MRNKNNNNATLKLVLAVAVFGLGILANAAKAPASNLKAKVGRASKSDMQAYAGLTFPGLTGTFHVKVGSNRLPIYLGGDLDVLFVSYWAASGVSIIPALSGALHIPTKSIVTPTIGLSVGPQFNLGGGAGAASEYVGRFASRYTSDLPGFSRVNIAVMVKPGVLVNLEKGMDLHFDLRMGYAGWFVFRPTLGMRFAI